MAGYQAGALLRELAVRFGVDPTTVSRVLERKGVPRRYRLIGPDGLKQVQRWYEAGDSLASIGRRVGVP